MLGTILLDARRIVVVPDDGESSAWPRSARCENGRPFGIAAASCTKPIAQAAMPMERLDITAMLSMQRGWLRPENKQMPNK